MQKSFIIIIKNFKNTESAQLWTLSAVCGSKSSLAVSVPQFRTPHQYRRCPPLILLLILDTEVDQQLFFCADWPL